MYLPAMTVRTAARLGTIISAFVLLLSFGAQALAAPTAQQWVKSFWPAAKSAGITWNTYEASLGNFTPDPEVLEKARSQAEFNMAIWDYLDFGASSKRIADGRAALQQYAASLAKIEARYGVDRYTVVAIWGMESTYGQVFQDPTKVRSTIRSLATLAYAGGSRSKYGRQQLIAALKIVQRGDVKASGMTGSWAGAMGHTQFIPTTYNAYAVDFDGDGRRNIWTAPVDALASTAHYLKVSGWVKGQTWGYEVALPKGFNTKAAAGRERTIAEWLKLGVARPGGKAFPRKSDRASLYLPAGAKGPAFLLLKNFRVIKRYNNANAYALAVGHLSDRLRGGAAIAAAWPRPPGSLSLEEREKIQSLLAARGLYSGNIDGKLGDESRAAITAYQAEVGMTPADGVESRRLLQLLEAGR